MPPVLLSLVPRFRSPTHCTAHLLLRMRRANASTMYVYADVRQMNEPYINCQIRSSILAKSNARVESD